MKVLVVGAGITGVMTAYYAYKKGFDVTIVDQHGIATKCSYANGGQISVCNSQVWNTWSNLAKAITWLGRENAPLLIRPNLDLEKYSWLMKFSREIILGTADINTARTIDLGLQSRKLYAEIMLEIDKLEQLSNIEYNGILHIYTDLADYKQALNRTTFFKNLGLTWQDVPASKLSKLEPSLIGFGSNLMGGVLTPEDFTGDIHRFCVHVLTWLQAKGVRYIPAMISTKDELLDKFPSNFYVLSTGTELQKQAQWFNTNLDIYPVKGYSLTIEAPADNIPKVSLLDEKAKIVSSRLGNRFRVAGTAEFTGHDDAINSNRLKPLYAWVQKNFSLIDTSKAKEWACLRPMRPNMLPVWGKFKTTSNVFYHGGHGHLGWTLAPATAKNLIDQLL